MTDIPHWIGAVLWAFDCNMGDGHQLALGGWEKCESGADGSKGGKNNPLNTTLVYNGSKPFNSAGVQNYKTRLDGVHATISTLKESQYQPIITELLKVPIDLAAFARAVSDSPWGTGYDCLASVYGA